ncbi:hypothetical protein [Bacillus sp. JJ1474]|uniref:hypothetical protein n=1 Tax=Bacillus sp. JJ1474 TaxID=3122955 RepID=UPI0030006968
MVIDITTITVSDILVALNIIATSFFSFLIWRATVASNKTALAIKEAGEKEKHAIENQNRYLVRYNLSQIENILLSHSIERGFPQKAKANIEEAIGQIRDFELTNFFTAEEIKYILDFLNYLDKDFMKIFKKARVYSENPLYTDEGGLETMRRERQEYNKRERPYVEAAITEIGELKSKIKS